MFKWLSNFLAHILHTFTNSKDGVGFDSRKISGFGVISTAISIGVVYSYSLYHCNDSQTCSLSWEGVLLVGVLLTFGALYLMILNPEQIEKILSIIYGNKDEPKEDKPSN